MQYLSRGGGSGAHPDCATGAADGDYARTVSWDGGPVFVAGEGTGRTKGAQRPADMAKPSRGCERTGGTPTPLGIQSSISCDGLTVPRRRRCERSLGRLRQPLNCVSFHCAKRCLSLLRWNLPVEVTGMSSPKSTTLGHFEAGRCWWQWAITSSAVTALPGSRWQ